MILLLYFNKRLKNTLVFLVYMVKRPKPTADILKAITGERCGLIRSVHWGMSEVDFRDIYRVLDFKEMVAFAAGSRKQRECSIVEFSDHLENDSLYELLSHVYRSSMPWVNKYMDMGLDKHGYFGLLNPFSGRDLKRRSELFKGDESTLRDSLEKSPLNFEFSINAKVGDVVLDFMPQYPCSGPEQVDRYSKRLEEVFDEYPAEFSSLRPSVYDLFN